MDPLIFAAVAVMLTCCIPARRATQVDPIVTLKCELLAA